LNNLQGLFSKTPEFQPTDPEKISAITSLRFDNVHFKHQSATRPALEGISFEVKRGETIAFVGPSGAGKTTLVKLLVGLYSPSYGHIHYNDFRGDRIDFDEFRHQIGFVTQDTQLFSGTIRENLRFVNPNATDEQIMDVVH